MRVLRISHSAAVDEWRGRERELGRLGVDVTTLSATTEELGGVTVTLAPRPGEQVAGVRRVGRHPALFIYDPLPLWRALGHRWDVIDIHEEPFALSTAEILLLRALRRNRAPVVLYTAQNLRKRYPLPFRWFERRSLRVASGISACNVEAARVSEDKGFPGRARVIPLGVDMSEFAPGPADAADRSARVVVGYLGRLVPEKGVGVLLDALALDSRLHARVAGSGPALEQLQAQVRRQGLDGRVEFLGPILPRAVPDFYRSLDVLAIPSLPTARWTEQFGRVAIEAMACGIPVVSSDAGALPDVVGGAGIIVPRGDAAALARAVDDASGSKAHELRIAGFGRVRQCTWAAVAAQYLELYNSVRHMPSHPGFREVEVVVVAYGHPDLLRDALEPVVGMTITVVDNSSLVEIEALCRELGVRYIDAGANLGFAAAVDIALRRRVLPDADLLLLNPDARISADGVVALQRALHESSDLASVGPAQVDDEGRASQVSWFFPTPAKAWLEAMGLAGLRRGPRFVIGAVLMLRAEALAQVGEFDERFFLYAEETDWAYRAHLLGWRHREVDTVQAFHRGAGTSTDSREREVHFHASQERYFRKHFGLWGWRSARAAAWLGSLARALVLPGARGRESRRRAALYRLGPLRVESRLARTVRSRAGTPEDGA